MTKIGVLASGRGSNFKAIYDAIKSGEIKGEIVLLFSNRPDAGAVRTARDSGIHTVVVDSKATPKEEFDRILLETLVEYDLDLVLLAGYMKIVGADLINAFPNRIMNMHPSLLPSFKGMNAQEQAIEYGAKVAGCTVHFVDEGMDTGPIILQAAIGIREEDTAESLSARILLEEHRLYVEAIKLFVEGRLSVEGRRVHIRKV